MVMSSSILVGKFILEVFILEFEGVPCCDMLRIFDIINCTYKKQILLTVNIVVFVYRIRKDQVTELEGNW